MFITLIQRRCTLLDVPALHCTNKSRQIGMFVYCSSSLIMCMLVLYVCVCENVRPVLVCAIMSVESFYESKNGPAAFFFV